MEPFFDVCIFTNGRASFDYCKRSLETQTLKPKIHIIRDMTMIDGINHILESDKINRYFMKVDDDFIFHSRAIEYIHNYRPWEDKVAMRYWHLWDMATRTKIESVKVYDKKCCKRIGFSVSSSGRIDPNFLKRCRSKGFRYQRDLSPIAIHACNPRKDQLAYEELWREQAPKKMHKKLNRDQMLSCKVSLDEQFDNRDKIVSDRNAPKHTFGHFLGKR